MASRSLGRLGSADGRVVVTQRYHYAALDGIRGFAALSVVLFHLGHWLGAPLAANSSLAVDLFFCLSGYVLPLAYDKRLATGLSPFRFLLLRVIRLMPLVVLATLISAAYVVARVYAKHEDVPLHALATATVLGLINLPYMNAPLALGGTQLFPLNGPQYTLFLEGAVNAVWMFTLKLSQPVVAMVATVLCFAILAAGGVLGGDTPGTFWAGFPRVGASFFAGMALYHLYDRVGVGRGWDAAFWTACVAMVGLFYLPAPLPFGLELAWLAVLSPVLVLSGARLRIGGKVRSIALLGGELSYPVYVLHYPIFCWVNAAFQTAAHRQDIRLEGPLVLAAVIVGSYVALKIYDEPLRRHLDDRVQGPPGQSTRGQVNPRHGRRQTASFVFRHRNG